LAADFEKGVLENALSELTGRPCERLPASIVGLFTSPSPGKE
jgi:hypothetical protein